MINYVKRREGIAIRRVEKDLLLLDMENEKIHQFNESASFIWDSCDKSSSEIELAKLLAQRFQVEEHVALNDVSVMVAKLRALNLLIDS
jgi:hypothetical protein